MGFLNIRDTGDGILSADEEALEQRMLQSVGNSDFSKPYGIAIDGSQSGDKHDRREYKNNLFTMTTIVADVEGDFRIQSICRHLQPLLDVQFWIQKTDALIMVKVEVSMIGVSMSVTSILADYRETSEYSGYVDAFSCCQMCSFGYKGRVR